MLGQPLGEIERRRAADIMREVAVHLLLESRIGLGLRVGFLQLEDQRHQRFGDKAAAVDAEMAALVRPGAEGIRLLNGHARLVTGVSAIRAAACARGAHEGADLVGVFLARRPLDAGGDIDARRAGDRQRLADIAGVEPAG